jgi:hypothetical protein
MKIQDFPKYINAGKFDDTPELTIYDKNAGVYEYSQKVLTPDGDGDFDYGEYNLGYSLSIDINTSDGIMLNTKVSDLGRKAQRSFSKKYRNLKFDSIEATVAKIEKIIEEFDNL